MRDTHFEHAEPAEVGHETTDFSLGPVVAGTIFLVVLTALAFVTMRWLFVAYDVREQRQGPPPHALAAERPALPPEPRLQANPLLDLRQLRQAEDAVLNTYGWVDARQGVVRIPVERAMELLVRNPPPARGGRGGTP